MLKTDLKNYAKLLVRKGLNVQRGQSVIISAQIETENFVCLVAEECYRAGAERVETEWQYTPLSRIQAERKTLEELSRVTCWQEEKMREECKNLPARLYLISEDPDALNGIDPIKYAEAARARSLILKPYRDKTENRQQWCIAAAAGEAWAKNVFPKDTGSVAKEKLWNTILSCSRSIGNPIGNWNEHNAFLASRSEWLNSLNLRSLEYKSENGTHLKVGLMKESIFAGGVEKTLSGIEFNPNIPSEEVFTTPKKGNAEGVVYSTKPLSYQGQIIRNFSLRFEGGKVVEAHASQGEAALKKMLAADEGAAYLGECALVSSDSPVGRSGLLFYNTLFDENASCHFALGRGFPECIRGFENYRLEELREMGLNDSAIHVDFMMGTDDLEITGVTESGERVKIFENGGWVK